MVIIMSPPWKGRETYCVSILRLSIGLSVTKSCLRYNLITFTDISKKLHTSKDVSCKRTITLACLFFQIIPLVA